MDRVPQRVQGWWRRRSPAERRQATALALISLFYILHTLTHSIFFIEDAAITLSYARNLVDGEGLVAFPGGERVEGFSNPLWTFFIAGLHALGVPTWTAAKVLGAVFGVLTLPLVFDIVRRARPDGREDVALVAPLLLAASPQFVLWNTSGLENSLFCLLLAAGVCRLLRELAGDAKGPWSALFFVMLAMTRPEGIAYAAFAGVALVLDAVATRRLRPLLAWVPTLLVPFALYQAWRYSYFAWEFPNTYYAKQHHGRPFRPFGWTVKGWKYINRYLLNYGIVAALPVLALGLFGTVKWRKWLVGGLLAVLAALVLWDGSAGLGDQAEAWPELPKLWVKIRVWTIATAALVAGIAAVRRPGWRARGLLWLNLCFGFFFALYSGGDWMDGFRWFNLTSVALFALVAVGLGELVDALPLDRVRLPRGASPRAIAIALPTLALALVSLGWSAGLVTNPDTAVRDVHRRVRYMTWVQRRLDIDHVTLMDVDMGAHMYFSNWKIVDMAGLVNVPIARHMDYDKRFIKQYIFEETRPTFAHVHGFWERTSKIPKLAEWRKQYLEIPGFPYGPRGFHIGNHVRRDVFIHLDRTPHPDETQHFEGGVRLLKVAVPSPVVPAGGLLFLDTQWASRARKHGFRLLVILDDGAGHRSVQTQVPGYGWYLPEKWKLKERVDGKFRVAVPPDLPHGDYALSLLLLDDETGRVLAAQGTAADLEAARSEMLRTRQLRPDGLPAMSPFAKPTTKPTSEASAEAAPVAPEAPPDPSGFGEGEWATGLVVTVTSTQEATKAAGEDYARARAHADEGECELAWTSFKDATRHMLRDLAWRQKREPLLRAELAGCWVQRADEAESRDAEVDALVEARVWDHRYPPLAERAEPLAQTLSDEGDTLSQDEAWKEAYAVYAQAMNLDPSRSWTRRSAEVARDHMLGIIEEEPVEDEAEEPEEDEAAEAQSP
jgi:hypothetical protein